MIIHVTQEHINKGGHTSTSCPVYYALQDKGVRLAVGGNVFSDLSPVGLPHKISAIQMPKSVVKFVNDFDNHKLVKPFNFRIKMKK